MQGAHDKLKSPAGLDLDNIRSALSPGNWTLRWQVAEDAQLSATHCGQQGEVVYIGDGWGQRDHRNTDLGVTIPYVVRRHAPDSAISAFCTVYEAHKPGATSVKSVFRLAVPEHFADNVVVLDIKTGIGSDLVISQFDPNEVELETPAGTLRTDSHVAVIRVCSGETAVAALAEGTKASLNGVDLQADRLKASEALGAQVAERPG